MSLVMISSESYDTIADQGECNYAVSRLDSDERDTNQMLIDSRKNVSLTYCEECKENCIPSEGCTSSSLPLEPYCDAHCSSSCADPKRVCICGGAYGLVADAHIVFLLSSNQ